MRKLLIATFLLAAAISVRGQVGGAVPVDSAEQPKFGPTMLINHYSNARDIVGISGSGGINATSINSRFMRPFFVGGHIDQEMKDNVDKRLKAFNLLGADIDYEIRYSHRADKIKWFGADHVNWTIGLSDRQHFDLRFSDHAFRTAFYGNKIYEGDTVQLADITQQNLRYQQLEYGIALQKGAYTFALGAAYLKGESHRELNVTNAQLYSAPFGQEIVFDAIVSTAQSDTANTGIDAWNGHGASFDAGFQYHDSTWGTFLVQANNIGFIKWNEGALHQRIDSTYEFDGFYISDLLDIRDTVLEASVDSLTDAANPPHFTKSYSRYIPGTIKVAYAQRFKNGWSMVSGAMMRIEANYGPRFFIEGRKSWKKTTLKAQFNYGGYGGPGFGVSVSQYVKPFMIMVRSQQMEGWLLPNQVAGQHIGVGIFYLIKA